MTPTDVLIREVEALRPVLDNAGGNTSVQVRATLVDGTIQVKTSVKPYTSQGR